MIDALVKCRGNAHRLTLRFFVLLLPCVLLTAAEKVQADDWPQWMGPQRDGVWRESGTLERFTTNGPPRLWSVPILPSYVGPAVAGGRLFLLDRKAEPTESTRGRDVLWCHPAFADRKMWVHNGKELVCLDLAAKS